MKKIVATVLWGVVGVGGLLSLYSAVMSGNYGLSMAAIPSWTIGIIATSMGFTKAFGIDLLKMVEVA